MASHGAHGTQLSRSSSGKSSSAPHLPDSRDMKSYPGLSMSTNENPFMELTYRNDPFRTRTASQGKDSRNQPDVRPRTSTFGRESNRGGVRTDTTGQHNPTHHHHRNRTSTISQDTRPRTSSMCAADSMRPRSSSYSNSRRRVATNANATSFITQPSIDTSQESLMKTMMRNSAERISGISSIEQLDRVLFNKQNNSSQASSAVKSCTSKHLGQSLTGDYLSMNPVFKSSNVYESSTDNLAGTLDNSSEYMDLGPGNNMTKLSNHASTLSRVNEMEQLSISPPTISPTDNSSLANVLIKNNKSLKVHLPNTGNPSGISDYIDLSLVAKTQVRQRRSSDGSSTTPRSMRSIPLTSCDVLSPSVVKPKSVSASLSEDGDSYSVFQPGNSFSRQSSYDHSPTVVSPSNLTSPTLYTCSTEGSMSRNRCLAKSASVSEESSYTVMSYGGLTQQTDNPRKVSISLQRSRSSSRESLNSNKSKTSPTPTAHTAPSVSSLSNTLSHINVHHSKSSSSSETNSTPSSKNDLTMISTDSSRPLAINEDVPLAIIAEPFPGLFGDVNVIDPMLSGAISTPPLVTNLQIDISDGTPQGQGGVRPKTNNSKSIGSKSKKKKSPKVRAKGNARSKPDDSTFGLVGGLSKQTSSSSESGGTSLLSSDGSQSICSSYTQVLKGPSEYVECENRLYTSMGSLPSTVNGNTLSTLHHHHRSRSPSPKCKSSHPPMFDLAVLDHESKDIPTSQQSNTFLADGTLVSSNMKKGSVSAVDIRTVSDQLPRQTSQGTLPISADDDQVSHLIYASLDLSAPTTTDDNASIVQNNTTGKRGINSDEEQVTDEAPVPYAQIDFAKSESLKTTKALRDKLTAIR